MICFNSFQLNTLLYLQRAASFRVWSSIDSWKSTDVSEEHALPLSGSKNKISNKAASSRQQLGTEKKLSITTIFIYACIRNWNVLYYIITIFQHHMFRPLRAILRWNIKSIIFLWCYQCHTSFSVYCKFCCIPGNQTRLNEWDEICYASPTFLELLMYGVRLRRYATSRKAAVSNPNEII
jgi:hypothetical protein